RIAMASRLPPVAIGHPLRDAAVDSQQPEGVRLERVYRKRSRFVLLAAAVTAVGKADTHLVAPPVARNRAGARRVFPFRLGRQPVTMADLLRQPGGVLLTV